MVLKKFRITHSMLVEHYQYIEAHLEAIYAAVSDEPFWNALEEIEKDSLGTVVRELQELDKQKGLNIFTNEEYAALRKLTARRNYWCHFCYCDLAFNLKTGGPAHKEDITKKRYCDIFLVVFCKLLQITCKLLHLSHKRKYLC